MTEAIPSEKVMTKEEERKESCLVFGFLLVLTAIGFLLNTFLLGPEMRDADNKATMGANRDAESFVDLDIVRTKDGKFFAKGKDGNWWRVEFSGPVKDVTEMN